MARCLAKASDSVLLVVDVQPNFMAAINESDRVIARARFITEVAKLLDVPTFATEQYPSRMGGTHSCLVDALTQQPMAKMKFSCCGSQELMSQLQNSGKSQIVLVGIETHICVNQTAHDLLGMDFNVIVCADATSSRTEDRHQIGLDRLRHAGAIVAHSESVVYEWLETAEHPKFREALRCVKEATW